MMAKNRQYRRWISIGGDDPFDRSVAKAREIGLEIRAAGKPGMVAWYGFRLFGSPERMIALEQWWIAQGIEFFIRRPRGAWDI